MNYLINEGKNLIVILKMALNEYKWSFSIIGKV